MLHSKVAYIHKGPDINRLYVLCGPKDDTTPMSLMSYQYNGQDWCTHNGVGGADLAQHVRLKEGHEIIEVFYSSTEQLILGLLKEAPPEALFAIDHKMADWLTYFYSSAPGPGEMEAIMDTLLPELYLLRHAVLARI